MQSNLETASILTAALTLNDHSNEAMLAYIAMMEFESYRLGYKETQPEALHCVDTRKCLIDSYVDSIIAIPCIPENWDVVIYLYPSLKTDISVTLCTKTSAQMPTSNN